MLAGTSCQLVINIDKTQVQRSKSTTVFNDSFFFFFFLFFVAVVAVVMKKKKKLKESWAVSVKKWNSRIPSKELMEGGEDK